MKKKKVRQQLWSSVPTHDSQGKRLSKADRKHWREMQRLVALIADASFQLQSQGKNIS